MISKEDFPEELEMVETILKQQKEIKRLHNILAAQENAENAAHRVDYNGVLDGEDEVKPQENSNE